MKRTMELYDVIAGVLDQKTMDYLEETCLGTIGEVEWDLEVTSYTEGSPAVLWGDNAHPAEGCEFEVDMTPTAVACHFTQVLVPLLPTALVDPAVLMKIWYAISDCEQQWQDNNLDEEVHECMQGDE